MGGPNSGRRPSVETFLKNQQEQFIETRGEVPTIELPNLSGVQNEALKTGTGLTAGSVLFTGADGTIAQDNANFFWDDTNNRLGIGTTSPTRELEIFTNDTGLSSMEIEQSGTGDPAIEFLTTGVRRFIVGIDNSDGDKFKIAEDSDLSGNARLTIDGSGNVGIGTTAPAALLDTTIAFAKTDTTERVYAEFGKSNDATNYGALQMSVTGAAAAANRFWSLQTVDQGLANAGNIVLQKDGGNVGIGTTSPLSRLHAVGTTYTAANLAEMYDATAFRVQTRSDQNWSLIVADVNSNVVGLQSAESTTQARALSLNPYGGNVGIGTTTPNQLLSLGAGSFASANTSAPTLTLSQVSGGFFISGGAFFYKGDKGTVTELAPR